MGFLLSVFHFLIPLRWPPLRTADRPSPKGSLLSSPCLLISPKGRLKIKKQVCAWTCGSQVGMFLTYVARVLSQKYLKMQRPIKRSVLGGGGTEQCVTTTSGCCNTCVVWSYLCSKLPVLVGDWSLYPAPFGFLLLLWECVSSLWYWVPKRSSVAIYVLQKLASARTAILCHFHHTVSQPSQKAGLAHSAAYE